MDRKFGAPWNVVIGEYFSFEITYEARFSMGLRGAPPPRRRPRARRPSRERATPVGARSTSSALRGPPPRAARLATRRSPSARGCPDRAGARAVTGGEWLIAPTLLRRSPSQVKNLLYLFMGGTKGILLWKSQ